MNGFAAVTPDFQAMPPELCTIARWVVWKEAKVPYWAGAVNSRASVTEPGTWTSFPQAQAAYEEGGYLGVGFVLAGDGIAGIDLDKCVNAGEPDDAALSLLVRGFGYVEGLVGARGRLDGVSVELYTSKRYLTVTGHTLRKGPLVPLPGFTEVAKAIRGSDLQRSAEEEQKKTEAILCPPLTSSVGSLPTSTIPTQTGQRHRCLFELARYLKGVSPGASRQELRDVVAGWHKRHLSVIGTKEFSVTWADFLNGWEKVQQPHGVKMKSILETIDHSSLLPEGLMALGYGTAGNQLVKICAALQAHHGAEPFFLSARQAADLLGVHFTDASKMLAALVSDGVLTLVLKGVGRVASRYRFEETAWHV